MGVLIIAHNVQHEEGTDIHAIENMDVQRKNYYHIAPDNIQQRMSWFTPALEKHGCHAMIMPWSYHGHDHAMMTAWQPCYLAWSSWLMAWSWYDYHISMIHIMIMVWSSCLPCFFEEKLDCSSMLSQLLAAIYHYGAFGGIYASKLASQYNYSKKTQNFLR